MRGQVRQENRPLVSPREVCPFPLTLLHPVLLSFLAGLLAAVVAWQLNRVLPPLPAKGRILLGPLGEEAAKTLLALLLGANIFFSHFFFGVVEGAWESVSVRRTGFYAGLAALAGHSVFGFVTVYVYEWYGTIIPALAAGYLVHAAWNYAVIAYFAQR